MLTLPRVQITALNSFMQSKLRSFFQPFLYSNVYIKAGIYLQITDLHASSPKRSIQSKSFSNLPLDFFLDPLALGSLLINANVQRPSSYFSVVDFQLVLATRKIYYT
jgi:hypothetical protein